MKSFFPVESPMLIQSDEVDHSDEYRVRPSGSTSRRLFTRKSSLFSFSSICG